MPEQGLGERRISGWHALMRSNGGQVPISHAAERPSEMKSDAEPPEAETAKVGQRQPARRYIA